MNPVLVVTLILAHHICTAHGCLGGSNSQQSQCGCNSCPCGGGIAPSYYSGASSGSSHGKSYGGYEGKQTGGGGGYHESHGGDRDSYRGSYDPAPSYYENRPYSFSSHKGNFDAAVPQAPPPPSAPAAMSSLTAPGPMSLVAAPSPMGGILPQLANMFSIDQPVQQQQQQQQQQLQQVNAYQTAHPFANVATTPIPIENDKKGGEKSENDVATRIPELVEVSPSKFKDEDDEPAVKFARFAKEEKERAQRKVLEGDNMDKATKAAPYLTYYNQQCAGEILGSSRGETVASASEKCARLNCQAANARSTGNGKYDIVYLKTVQSRSNKRGIYCVSNVKIPLKKIVRATRGESEQMSANSSEQPAPARFSSFNVAQELRAMPASEDDQRVSEAIERIDEEVVSRKKFRDPVPDTFPTEPATLVVVSTREAQDITSPVTSSAITVETTPENPFNDEDPTLPPSYYYRNTALRLI